jgi:tetratricopeptide (TPR) repeat protein
MSNAFYQGISALAKKAFVYAVVGLGIGLIVGFRLANDQYRKRISDATQAQALQAASQLQSGGPAANSQEMINQTRAIIEKARQNPNDFDAQIQAADQFMQIRRPEGAMEFLLQANKLRPADNEVMSELAGAYFFQEKFPEAITWARKSLAKNQSNPPAKFYLAYSLIMSSQNLNEAEKLLTDLEASSSGAPDSARQALADMRARLQQARQGGAKPAGDPKTTLSHGPEENSGVKR